MLTPFCVLGHVDLSSCRPPCFGECVGIVDNEVGRVARPGGESVRRNSEVDLGAVTYRESVPSAIARSSGKAESLIVIKRYGEVVDRNNRGCSLYGCHAGNGIQALLFHAKKLAQSCQVETS
jgi:hypothetical protein